MVGGVRLLGTRGSGRVGQRGVCFAVYQCDRFPGLKLEIGGEQVVYAVEFPAHAFRTVSRGVGEDMVQLMRQHTAERAAENLPAIFRAKEQKFFLDKAADRRAVHVGEREDDAVADMSPA